MSNETQYELVLQTPIGTKFTSTSFVYLVHKANDLVENADEILSEGSTTAVIWEVGSKGCVDVLVAIREQNATRNDWKFCV